MMNRFHSIARQFLPVLIAVVPNFLSLHAQEIRELWVPSEHLDVLLKKKPRAVVLTPEQYQTLILDSQRAVIASEEKKNTPPVPATVRSVSLTGRVLPGADVIPVTAEYTVESLTDDWIEVPLLFPLTHFGQVEIDDQSALRVTKAKNSVLITHGKGSHKVKVVYHLPVTRTAGGESIEIHSPEIPSASLTLEIEKDMALSSALPFHIKQQKAYFTIPSQNAGCWKIEWAAQKVAPIPGSAIFQTCSWLYTIDSSKVQADLGLVLNANLRRLPAKFTVSLPGKVRLLSVEGSELQRWSRNPGGDVTVELLPGDRETTDLRLRIEQDVSEPGSGDEYKVSLPIATVQGVHRASGTMTILGSEDISVRQISTGPLTVPIPDDVEGPATNLPNYVASFQFPIQNESPSLSFAEIKNRFNVQLDSLVTLNREAITIERTLLYLPIEGNIFDASVTVPDSEEIVSVSATGRDDFSWKESNSTVSLRWDTGLSQSTPASVKITTRRDPADWYQLSATPTRLQFASIKVSEAESLSGYIAVTFDSSWLIQTNETTGLSPRDGRNTPVRGNLAWFRLDDYTLDVEVSRRPPEIEVVNTAYALPLANTLEIEGQLALTILKAGIRELQIAAPPETSAHLRFESPVIAQQSRDDTTGTWTVTFHRELTGDHPIRYHINLPVEITGDDNNDGEKKFEIVLPKLTVPSAKRIRGEWIMEANTDTELSFTTENLDAADSLQITRINGYQPRHRIISAFRYRDNDWKLTLSGTRHPHSELVKTVVDKLKIDTVVSTNGTNRHQAQITVRTAGDQFLDIKLPPEAVIWTLNVDGERMKPVRSGKDQLRIPLPAHEDNDQSVEISIIYATAGKNWRSSGRENLQPVTLAPQIPVLQSDWQLHLPEGFDYQRFKTNLEKDFSTNERILLGHLAKSWLERRRLATGDIAAPTEWTNEAAPSEIWYRAFLAGEAALDLEQQGNHLDAMMKTNEAQILYQDIQNRYTYFQPDAVNFKLHTVEEAKRRLKGKIKQQYETGKTVADSPDGIPQIASNYVIRMQESVKRADEAALRGSQLMADGDLEGTIGQYSNAIDLLPNAPMTDQRRRAYIKQYSRAATQLARQYADTGRYNESISLVENVLRPSITPDNREAKRLLEQLNDPEYYSPALTPQHLERIRKAKLAIKTGQGYLDYGDYDRAEREYCKTLNADRYNSAARRSLEEVERQRLNYYDAARDQTRSTFLREIAEEWEVPVPTAIDSPDIAIGRNSSTSEISRNEEKLKSIIIPSVEFSKTPLNEAIEFLQKKSVEL
ncbi:MAG: tetratricopeptide repeat protein, partial [Verrucomicrobiales bacterium]|nr:tetratricopeptide repeat protein [Verrucomicrobiales bacterium]